METSIRLKPSFSVVGKQGSTESGEGFVERLWAEANASFAEVAPLARRAPDGSLAGVWGLMSDFSMEFQPWANGFSEGLYLAGVEVDDTVAAPPGWAKWTIPGFEYLRAKVEGDVLECFREGLRLLSRENLALAGAVQDNVEVSEDGQKYLYFPIRRT